MAWEGLVCARGVECRAIYNESVVRPPPRPNFDVRLLELFFLKKLHFGWAKRGEEEEGREGKRLQCIRQRKRR